MSDTNDTLVTTEKPVVVDSPEAVDEHKANSRVEMAQQDSAVSSIAEKSSDTTQERPQGPQYPQGWKLATIIVALCLAVFVVALDQTIVATAIPTITDHFHSVNDIGWYGSSYLLTRAALQPSFGRIYTHFDVKYTFLVTIAIFELGSLVCATAPSSNALIVGRAIAGAGVGGLFTGSIIIVIDCAPLSKRPAIMGVIGSMWAIASVAGPLLGGVFTSKVSWRWCFYINLPIGAVTIVIIAFLLHTHQQDSYDKPSIWQRIMKLDLIGASLVILATVCLLLALQWGGSTYPWNDSRIIGLFVGAGCLTIVLIYFQIKLGDKSTLPPSLFRTRNTLCAFFFSGFFGAGFYAVTYYLAVYYQSVRGSSAFHAGIQMLPLLVSSSISSTLVGFLISVIGYYTPFMILCMAMFAAGAGSLTTLAPTTPYRRGIGYQVLTGLGIGAGFESGIIVVQRVVEGPKIPVAISITSFLMSICGAAFLAISQTVFQHGILETIRSQAPQVDGHALLQNGATDISSLLASMKQEKFLPSVLQGYANGTRNVF